MSTYALATIDSSTHTSLGLKNCSQLALEFANHDDDKRSAYDQLKLLNEFGDNREVGLGVADVHVDDIESPELIKDRIEYASQNPRRPSKNDVNPDCGLRTRSWDIAYAKLTNTVKGAELARHSLSSERVEQPMRITEIIKRGDPVFSLEFFPPKTAEEMSQLYVTLGDLKSLNPGYISVTYGAGGGTRDKTIEIVTRAKHELRLESMAHLTCVANSKQQIKNILDELVRSGIKT